MGINHFGKSYFQNYVGYISANDKGQSSIEVVPLRGEQVPEPVTAFASKDFGCDNSASAPIYTTPIV